ncbi:MAG: toll/interleukin-1 receptor domain-containing protein [Phaeodactylibacter sp.]|nr:toll/interleukin-1 receptor domain-containing protein [Phaeodactylibacter sp.]
MGNELRKINVFVAYSREDESIRKILDAHLYSLIRQNRIIRWFDGLIEPGKTWIKEIEEKLEIADIVLLLISANFIKSDFCYGEEMKTALKNHEEGKSSVIPIIVSHCSWIEMPFSHLQVLPENGIPMTGREWSDINEACFNVVENIKEKVKAIQEKQNASLKSYWDEKNILVSEIKDLRKQKKNLISELQKYKIDRASIKINEDLIDILFLIYNDIFITLHEWANKFDAPRTTKGESTSIRNEFAVFMLLNMINGHIDGRFVNKSHLNEYNSDESYKKNYLLKSELLYLKEAKNKIQQLENIANSKDKDKVDIKWQITLKKLKTWMDLLEGRGFFLENE